LSDEDDEYYEDEFELLTLRNIAIGVVALLLVIALILPFTVKAYQGEVASSKLQFGNWKHDSGESGKENMYLGYVKTYTNVYETKDGKSGKLFVVSVNTIFTPSTDSLEDRIIETVEEKAKDAGVALRGSPSKGSLKLDSGIDATKYEWDGDVSSTVFFASIGTDVKIVATVWNDDKSTIICAGYVLKFPSSLINDVNGLIKSVEESEA